MANNCLVTKLKDIVDNNELQFLNGLRINYFSGYEANNRVIAFYTERGSYRIISEHPVDVYSWNTLLAEGVRDFTTPELVDDSLHIKFPDNNGVCDIISKYAINSLGYNYHHPILGTRSGYTSFCIDAGQLEYCNNIKEIFAYSPNFKGTLNPEKLENLIAFYTNNMDDDRFDSYKMDITKLSSIVNLARINCKGSKLVYGNLESLGALVNLNMLTLWGTATNGDLKTLCDNLVTHGKTSGILEIDSVSNSGNAGGERTWNNEQLTYEKVKELNNGGNQYVLKVEFGSSYTGGYRIVPLAE